MPPQLGFISWSGSRRSQCFQLQCSGHSRGSLLATITGTFVINIRQAPMPRWHVIRPTFGMTVCAITTFVLLIGLGTWQLQRLEWKENLIAERAEKKVLPPLAISEVPDDDWRRLEHRRITVRGRFQHDKEILIVNQTRRSARHPVSA